MNQIAALRASESKILLDSFVLTEINACKHTDDVFQFPVPRTPTFTVQAPS